MKLFIVLVLIAFPSVSFGIKCYVCKHAVPDSVNGGCSTVHSQSDYLQTCRSPTSVPPGLENYVSGINSNSTDELGKQVTDFSCASTIAVAYEANIEVVLRMCVPYRASRDEIYSEGVATGQLSVCNTDGCNGKSSSEFYDSSGNDFKLTNQLFLPFLSMIFASLITYA